MEKIKEREVRLYRRKQKIVQEILQRAEGENWIEDIASSKVGKRFLLELALKSISSVLPEEQKVQMDVSVKQFEELRRWLLDEE